VVAQAQKDPTRREVIARVVAEYERSGLTRRRFSEQSGIAISTLDYWRRRSRDQNQARIVPVRVEASEAASGSEGRRGFQLRLPNGVRIKSGWDFPEQALARLLRVATEQ
jgi:hypothetical protein